MNGKDSQLTHDEVVTLFHEFGHGLNQLLTRIDIADVSGINGVPWDAVELPSQFNENYAWQEEVLNFLSAHETTKEPLPKDKLDALIKAKNFESAMAMLRQLEFALFDFRLHLEYDPEKGSRVYETLGKVKDLVSVVPQYADARFPDSFSHIFAGGYAAGYYSYKWAEVLAETLGKVKDLVSVVPQYADARFPDSFSHIFAGGYAAGYYSYKWAEVLAADAFGRFEEEGIFNEKAGEDFKDYILACGGASDPMKGFISFRGRKPEVDALLRQSGISFKDYILACGGASDPMKGFISFRGRKPEVDALLRQSGISA